MKARLISFLSVSVIFLSALAEPPAMWTAVSSGDVEAVKAQLLAGVKVNAPVMNPGVPGSGGTPLHLAAAHGHIKLADFLLGKGADIEARAKDDHHGTPLEWAAYCGKLEMVKSLIAKGADPEAKNLHGRTVLDAARSTTIPSEDRDAVITLLGGNPEPKLDRQPFDPVRPMPFKGSYFKNGEIHVNTYGMPEGKPLTEGHQDFKPSWSKTGDMLVFFRRLKDDPVTVNWITAICVINVDGSGLHQLTDGTHTDFNQTWTRDGRNLPIWNRKNPEKGSFYVMQSRVGAKPGEEYALTDKSYHSWAYTCLVDGRILVQSHHPQQGWGYYLMTPKADAKSTFEKVECEMAKMGVLDRVTFSPDETRIAFEYQIGHKHNMIGRTLYIADFDVKKRIVSNARPFANELCKPHWYAYPRWTKDGSAIVFHANKTGKGQIYLYTPEDGKTRRVSTDANADYRYPHCEATPK